MKRAIILLACVATSICSAAQQIPKDSSQLAMMKDEYLQKAKNKKSGAIALICGWRRVIIIAAAVTTSDAKNNLDNLFEPVKNSEDHEGAINGLVGTGLVAILGSIPLFISSHKYIKKAMSVSFKNEPALQLQKCMVFYRSVPSLSLKISL